jgi:predicted molibdopterin-dependent oxidoreductase YjgC
MSAIETMNVTLTINEKKVTVPQGSTILEAASLNGIKIPTLCHHPDLSNSGACRMCVVSVEKARLLQTACTTPVTEGMVVHTESDEARSTRKFVLSMLLTDHPNDCMVCEVNGDCELQDLVYEYGVEWPAHEGQTHTYEIDPDPNPFIYIDLNKCILCGRCVRACSEIQNRDVWNFAQRGFKSKLVAGGDQLLLDANCESCGACVAYCPVGALYDKMSIGLGRPNQVKKVRTTCSYCGVGCNFDLNVRDGQIIRVTSAEDAPVNGSSLCVKGRYGYDYVQHPDRLTRPLVRARYLSDVEAKVASGAWKIADIPDNPAGPNNPETFIQADWDTTLDLVAGKLTNIKKQHGGKSFGLLASAKCTNEENYLFNKFTRQLMTTHTIDHCARL